MSNKAANITEAAQAAERANELAGAMKRLGDAMQAGTASVNEFNAACRAYEVAEQKAKFLKDKADGVIYD